MAGENLAISFQNTEHVSNVMSDAQVQDLCPLDLKQDHHPLEAPSLGTLDVLPAELLIEIMYDLPLSPIMSIRNTSRRARAYVDTLPIFRTIMQQAPQAIRGLLLVQPSLPCSLIELYVKLRQRTCDHCSNLAHHLWLPTTTRLCWYCVQEAPAPFLEDEIKKIFRGFPEEICKIPSYFFLPSTFMDSKFVVEVPEKHRLYDSTTAAEIFRARTGRYLRLPNSHKFWPTDLHLIQHITAGAYRLIYGSTLLIAEDPPRSVRKIMGLILVPWVSPYGLEWAKFCGACLYGGYSEKSYTQEGFRDHLKACRVRPREDNRFLAKCPSFEPIRFQLRLVLPVPDDIRDMPRKIMDRIG